MQTLWSISLSNVLLPLLHYDLWSVSKKLQKNLLRIKLKLTAEVWKVITETKSSDVFRAKGREAAELRRPANSENPWLFTWIQKLIDHVSGSWCGSHWWVFFFSFYKIILKETLRDGLATEKVAEAIVVLQPEQEEQQQWLMWVENQEMGG